MVFCVNVVVVVLLCLFVICYWLVVLDVCFLR